MEIIWLRRAVNDLTALRHYIGKDNSDAAYRISVRLLEAVARLARHPAMGRPGRVPGTRELVIPGTPYIVPYRVRGGKLEILRVLHANQRWPGS